MVCRKVLQWVLRERGVVRPWAERGWAHLVTTAGKDGPQKLNSRLLARLLAVVIYRFFYMLLIQ